MIDPILSPPPWCLIHTGSHSLCLVSRICMYKSHRLFMTSLSYCPSNLYMNYIDSDLSNSFSFFFRFPSYICFFPLLLHGSTWDYSEPRFRYLTIRIGSFLRNSLCGTGSLSRPCHSFFYVSNSCSQRVSNPRPSAHKTDALTN